MKQPIDFEGLKTLLSGMRTYLKVIGWLFGASICLCTYVQADDLNLRTQLADLREDYKNCVQQVGQVRLELESLRRENQQIKSRLDTVLLQVSTRESAVDVHALMRKQKEEIITQVAHQIEQLADQIQKAIQHISTARQPNSVPPKVKNFKQGMAYTVKSGDTLSGIAKVHKTTVGDLQSANQIGDPAKELKMGQTIFIPQDTSS